MRVATYDILNAGTKNRFRSDGKIVSNSGKLFQPQNLPSRGLLEDYEIDFGIDALKAGEANFFYPNIMKLLSSCVRGVLIASPGKTLAVADLSNIEGRFAAWVSGELWKIEAFKDFDAGTGHDLYNLAYSRAFKIPVEEVTKAQRAIGKVMELACLHPDTPVLTSNGVKRIVEVLITDKLWDGEEWVTHKGLVARGVRQIVNVGGTEGLTPDHLVLTGKTWRPVSELVSNENILSLALETGSAALKSLGILTRLRVKSRIACLRVAYVVKRTLSGYGICVPEEQLNVRSAVLSPKEEIERNYTDTKISYLMRGKDTGCYLGYHPRLLDATPRTINSITLTGAGAYPCLVNGVRTEENFSNISSPFLDGVCRVSKWTERITTKVMNLVTYVSSVNSRIIKTVGLSSTCRNESMSLSPVYDIAHVGARNRFMILTASGPLMVHNCGYAGGVGAFLTMALGYGFDLEKLAEDNWDTLPDELVKEANSFYGYVIKRKMSTFGLSKEAFITSDVFKRVWRESNPNIASMWTRLEEAIRSAISNPQEVFEVGEFIKVLRNKNWLRIRLPSGRSLCYANPRLDERGEISYMGLNNYTRQWQRLKGYGGLFLENCLAGDSRVVTNTGVKYLIDVTSSDKVWDGVEFVGHSGVMLQGLKELISVNGIRMTPDHKILTEEGWKIASSCEGLNRYESGLPDGYPVSTGRTQEHMVDSLCVRKRDRNGGERIPETNEEAESILRLQVQGIHRRDGINPQNVRAPGLLGLALYARQVQIAYTSSMEKLRSAWYSCLRFLEFVSEFLERHGADLAKGHHLGAQKQSAGLLTGELCLEKLPTSGKQSKEQCGVNNTEGRNDSERGGSVIRGKEIDLSLSVSTRLEPQQSSGPVYDLMNCGPRNRFVVLDENDVPMVVHNCCQAGSRDILYGSMPRAEAAGFQIVLHVHDELVTEFDPRTELTLDNLCEILAAPVHWAPGLPLSAAGFVSDRYRK